MTETILVVGPSVPASLQEARPLSTIIHRPLVSLESFPFNEIMQETLLKCFLADGFIFTSKHAVTFFKDALLHFQLSIPPLPALCIGPVTAKKVESELACPQIKIASDPTQEGMVELIKQHSFRSLFWPRSKDARTLLSQTFFLIEFPLYAPVRQNLSIDFSEISEVFFTSPSSVKAFFSAFPKPPTHLRMSAIGPVTQSALKIFHDVM